MKKKYLSLFVSIGIVGFLVVLITGSTYAYWVWRSSTNKNVGFTTSGELSQYIIYDPGTAKFIGDFQPSQTFSGGIYTTVSVSKTSNASNISLYGTLNMDINKIDNDLSNYVGLKWAVTEGNSSSAGTVLREGNFTGKYNNDVMVIYSGIELTTSPKMYTIWIWLDSSLSPTVDISKKKIDTNIWMHIDQVYSQQYDTEGEYVITIPETGVYRLETWGAQGGSYGSYIGGYGGYSTGSINLEKNSKIYVNVGGFGHSLFQTTNTGGYNGGGDSGDNGGGKSFGGGGATHIATTSGLLSSLSQYAGNNSSPIIIVSGGGGGAVSASSSIGGAGGGIVGNSGTSSNGTYNTSTYIPLGGSQTAAGFAYGGSQRQGAFGRGHVGISSGWGGGGGAGYYGGGSGHGTTGAGGSGYIGNTKLTNKLMYCYQCTTSSDTSTLTYSTSNISSIPTSNYVKKGSGAARITLIK